MRRTPDHRGFRLDLPVEIPHLDLLLAEELLRDVALRQFLAKRYSDVAPEKLQEICENAKLKILN